MSYPFTLTNGQTADANQVMANFNAAAFKDSPTISNPTFTGTVTGAASIWSGDLNGQKITANQQLIGAGTATNDSASAGYIGEYVPGTLLVGSAVSLSSNVVADIKSIALTAGDWDVWATIAYGGSFTGSTHINAWINTVSATMPTIPNGGAYYNDSSGTGASGDVKSVGIMRLSLAAPATAYLSTQVIFSGTATAYGFIGARRVR